MTRRKHVQPSPAVPLLNSISLYHVSLKQRGKQKKRREIKSSLREAIWLIVLKPVPERHTFKWHMTGRVLVRYASPIMLWYILQTPMTQYASRPFVP
jgi:hypothetical protein